MASSDRRGGRARRAGAPGKALPLGRVIDHGLMDSEGRRAGRVDDLLVELREDAAHGGRPVLELRQFVSGPLPRPASRLLAAIARACYRAIGVRDPQPATIEWSHVRMVDVAVHLDVTREAAGLRKVDAASERLVRGIPGAEKSP